MLTQCVVLGGEAVLIGSPPRFEWALVPTGGQVRFLNEVEKTWNQQRDRASEQNSAVGSLMALGSLARYTAFRHLNFC
jgi:hypothetical protein